MSKAMRGRPRKIVEKIEPVVQDAQPEFVPIMAQVYAVQEGVLSAKDRMSEVMDILQPIIDRAGSVQCHNNCVTVTYGTYSECINITSPDVHVKRLVDRVLRVGV